MILKSDKRFEKVLEVKNLRVSFRTNGGTVKAVRGISFPLYKGRTLAIVGESGSGKSVTSKAILGILANNKIVEDGQIIYDGKDLLKVSEDQFSKIRGVKISMIFQDPLSSLNPIMIVGKQLVEAMILKSKADRKEAKRMLKRIGKLLNEADAESYQELHTYVKNLKQGDKPDISAYERLFALASERAIDKQMEKIKSFETQLTSFKTEHLQGDFDLKEAYKAGKVLYRPLKECVLEAQTDADDTIEVFPTVMKDIITSLKSSIKQRAILQKALTKYQVEDIFDLPPKVRATLQEVFPEESVFRSHMVEAVDRLLKHLTHLEVRTSQKAKIVTSLIEDYSKYIVSSKSSLSSSEAKARAIKLLSEVGIDEPERRYKQYPFELSGGMRQRIVIAIALSSSPEVLICDEPTTALDVTIQSQILELINKLKAEKNLSIVFITHDLGVVANMADDIAVMYAGKIVEYGSEYDIFYDPRHPYTRALLGSMPDLDTKEKLNSIPGTPPNMLLPPKGDAFALRNKDALEIDFLALPPEFVVSPTHYAATWLLHDNAPDVDVSPVVLNRIQKALSSHPEYTPKADNMKNSVLNFIERSAQ